MYSAEEDTDGGAVVVPAATKSVRPTGGLGHRRAAVAVNFNPTRATLPKVHWLGRRQRSPAAAQGSCCMRRILSARRGFIGIPLVVVVTPVSVRKNLSHFLFL